MHFEELYGQKKARIEERLRAYLPVQDMPGTEIYDALAYSLLAGGKRLRPILMEETYVLFGGQKQEQLVPFMVAIEMIHTYSLVHDDLPAMDNDLLRRGKKTTHAVYGEAMGILAGDGLLNLAFETALQSYFSEKAAPAKVLDSLALLGEKAGVLGMIGGQAADVAWEGQVLSEEQLTYIYTRKTGALLEAAMMIGARFAEASQEEIEAVERIAGKVGLAYQIQDDILDITGQESLLGKPLHSDEKNQKNTYAAKKGIEASKKEVKRLSREALEELKCLPGENPFLEQLMQKLVTREK